MLPRISIITICYNAASTITRTLRSVSAQTYPNIQYLIIDGASKDNTLELVRELAPEAEIYSERDKGIYDAMNKGSTELRATTYGTSMQAMPWPAPRPSRISSELPARATASPTYSTVIRASSTAKTTTSA